MTQDEIIEMARASGFMPAHDKRVQHFAKLVAAKEREACAKVCENAIASIWEYCPDEIKEASTNVCNNLAKAIRARGEA